MTAGHGCVLPSPEILTQIILLVPRETRRSCLLVSRLFHDLAVTVVFSRITIHFGAWEYWYHNGSHSSETFRPHENRRATMAADILRRITVDTGFARKLRRLGIIAHKHGGSNDDCVFQLHCLSLAVQNLVNVRSLIWYGTRPGPSLEIVEMLAKACPLLCDISLPCSALKMFEDALPAQPHKHSLVRFHRDTSEPLGGLSPSHLRLCYNRRSRGIFARDLHPGNLLFLPSQCLATLETLLGQLPQLQSFAISSIDDQAHSLLHALASSLEHNTRLTSLAVLGYTRDYRLTPEDLQVLSDFLSNRQGIRRLRLATSRPCGSCLKPVALRVI